MSAVIHAPITNPVWDDENITLGDPSASIPLLKKPEALVYPIGKKRAVLSYCLAIIENNDSSQEDIMKAVAGVVHTQLSTGHASVVGHVTPIPEWTGQSKISEFFSEDRTEEEFNEVIECNCEFDTPVTYADLKKYDDYDDMEMAYYFGIIFLVFAKTPNRQNLPGFNENRRNALQQFLSTELQIFTDGNPLLSEEKLKLIHSAANSLIIYRSHMITYIARVLNGSYQGSALAFLTGFKFCANQGMSALKIIKEACVTYKFIPITFAHLRPEFLAANNAIMVINKAPAHDRPFLKAIHGSGYVPVDYNRIKNLAGICKESLIHKAGSLNNYQGGIIDETQKALVHAELARLGIDTNPQVVEVEADD